MSRPPFRIRVRIGQVEVEIGGDRAEVISTLDELGGIVEKVQDAFKLEGEANLNLKPGAAAEDFPKIPTTNQCSEAVISLLSTDWGKTPRTLSEIREAMEANAIFFPKTTLSGVLVWLVKKNKIRRWKDKRRGYVYTIHEVGEDG
ncbi:MAG: hypothetical protein QW638_03125 [Candidatus Bathyarchaeia archaeon]